MRESRKKNGKKNKGRRYQKNAKIAEIKRKTNTGKTSPNKCENRGKKKEKEIKEGVTKKLRKSRIKKRKRNIKEGVTEKMRKSRKKKGKKRNKAPHAVSSKEGCVYLLTTRTSIASDIIVCL